MKEKKVWGWTECILNAGTVQVHRITGVKGGYCSRHYHDFKHNLFLLLSGRMRVETWADGEAHMTELLPGDACSVAPPVLHRFRVMEDSVAVEVYFSERGDVNPEDITRIDQGGLVQEDEQ